MNKISDRSFVSAEAMLEATGLNWQVGVAPCIAVAGDTVLDTMGAGVVYREDTKETFQVCGGQYTPFQNADLARLAAEISREGEIVVDTGGYLGNGEKVWFNLANTEELREILPGDMVNHKLCLGNSHDGSFSLTVIPTTIRIVCQNTFAAAMSGRFAGAYRWRHTGGLPSTDDIVRVIYGWRSSTDRHVDEFQKMAKVRMDREKIQEIWIEVVSGMFGDDIWDAKEPRRQATREKAVGALRQMWARFDKESQELSNDSSWIAANAATWWLGHEYKPQRGGAEKWEARLEYEEIFGEVAEASRKAFTRFAELAEAEA